MIQLRTNKILIPMDFSETAQLAIKHGAYLAKFFKGELIITHVIKRSEILDILLPMIHLENNMKIEDIVSQKLEEIAEQVRKEYNIGVSTIVSSGNITSEIVEIAKSNKIDLIVMGTQGYTAMEEFLMGSNSYRVISKSPVPVMTVRKEATKFGYHDIVLPIDSSEHSRQKVNATISLAAKFSAKLHILGILGEEEKDYEYKMKIIVSQIEDLAKKEGVSYDSKVEYASNRAHQTLKYAKSINADLVVTMTDQNAEISSLLLGTYAHQLINYAKMPVLSFKPESHQDDIPFSFAGLGF
ncbi:MAG: universal stress protein [Bacteroidia bacterium]